MAPSWFHGSRWQGSGWCRLPPPPKAGAQPTCAAREWKQPFRGAWLSHSNFFALLTNFPYPCSMGSTRVKTPSDLSVFVFGAGFFPSTVV